MQETIYSPNQKWSNYLSRIVSLALVGSHFSWWKTLTEKPWRRHRQSTVLYLSRFHGNCQINNLWRVMIGEGLEGILCSKENKINSITRDLLPVCISKRQYIFISENTSQNYQILIMFLDIYHYNFNDFSFSVSEPF